MDDLEHFCLSPKESRDMKRKERLRTINVNRAMNYCRL